MANSSRSRHCSGRLKVISVAAEDAFSATTGRNLQGAVLELLESKTKDPVIERPSLLAPFDRTVIEAGNLIFAGGPGKVAALLPGGASTSLANRNRRHVWQSCPCRQPSAGKHRRRRPLLFYPPGSKKRTATGRLSKLLGG